ncbi:carbohydrate porin [Paludisphaera sp.]|uniref:carbohydrate porin n=1 Tax=Paludisphaera sp. TaxID=2017432 RepID=UPI00301C2FF6
MRMSGRVRRCRVAWAMALLGVLALAPGAAKGQSSFGSVGSRGTGLQSGPAPPPPKEGRFEPIDGKDFTKIEVTDAPFFGATGDWFGWREAMLDDGIDVRPKFTQFYQGVASGGLNRGFRYGVKFDYFGTIEGEKLFGWRGLFINLQGESRFGESVNDDVGSFVAPNFAMQFPKATGAASALSTLQIDQFLTPDLVVTFGKMNALAAINAHPFIGGNGIDRFMNDAFVFDPIYGRTLPYSTPGAGLQYLRDGEPVFVFQVLDSSGRPDTSGLRQMFRNGVSLFTQVRRPINPAGLPGAHAMEIAYASGKYSPLSEDELILLPTVPVDDLVDRSERTNTWAVNYTYEQFLFLDDEDPGRGWGIFATAGIADQRTNPVFWKTYFGAAGMSPLPGRTTDSFGVGYYYLGVSDVLKGLLRKHAPVRDEQIFEMYYNAKIASWFTLTADIQAIDPAQLNSRTAFLFALRAKIDF